METYYNNYGIHEEQKVRKKMYFQEEKAGKDHNSLGGAKEITVLQLQGLVGQCGVR